MEWAWEQWLEGELSLSRAQERSQTAAQVESDTIIAANRTVNRSFLCISRWMKILSNQIQNTKAEELTQSSIQKGETTEELRVARAGKVSIRYLILAAATKLPCRFPQRPGGDSEQSSKSSAKCCL